MTCPECDEPVALGWTNGTRVCTAGHRWTEETEVPERSLTFVRASRLYNVEQSETIPFPSKPGVGPAGGDSL